MQKLKKYKALEDVPGTGIKKGEIVPLSPGGFEAYKEFFKEEKERVSKKETENNKEGIL